MQLHEERGKKLFTKIDSYQSRNLGICHLNLERLSDVEFGDVAG